MVDILHEFLKLAVPVQYLHQLPQNEKPITYEFQSTGTTQSNHTNTAPAGPAHPEFLKLAILVQSVHQPPQNVTPITHESTLRLTCICFCRVSAQL